MTSSRVRYKVLRIIVDEDVFLKASPIDSDDINLDLRLTRNLSNLFAALYSQPLYSLLTYCPHILHKQTANASS